MCFMCGGDYKDNITSSMLDINNKYFIIKNISAQVCTQCGEVLYNSEVFGQLEELTDKMKKENGEIIIADFVSGEISIAVIEPKKNDMNEKIVEKSKTFEITIDSVAV